MADMMLNKEQTDETNFELNAVYSGKPLNALKKDVTEAEYAQQEIERTARRVLGLTITKQLLYYPLPYEHTTKPINVDTYMAVDSKTYTTEVSKKKKQITWYTIKATLENGKSITIHNNFLAEMQRPDFIDEMKKEESAQ